MEEPHGEGATAAGLEIDIENFGFDVARHHRERGEQGRALPCYDVVELEATGADLCKIVIEPTGQSGIEINDIAAAVCGKEARGGMVEIVDCVLQLLKD